MRRVFLIVLDSLGIGAMPDAKSFGDEKCNTLRSISKSKEFKIPTLLSLGLGNIDGVDYLPSTDDPMGAVARMTERSMGKDTTIGHWEITGVVSEKAFPTYPNGFPEDVISAFSKVSGRGVLCNRPYSGTEVIADYGQRHIESGDLIVYTSADSVFQIAAHESVVPIDELYKYCQMARDILVGEHSVGRVIARPFTGYVPEFVRTANRRDFSLAPPQNTMLNAIISAGKDVRAVGKISDIFADCGITKKYVSHSNAEGMQITTKLLQEEFEGLCFVNLVDFDMLYGHRQNVDGYAKALSEFDAWLGEFINEMRVDDLLLITADHGCDPADNSTDHTREYTPLLCYGKNIIPVNLGTRSTFADIAATVTESLEVEFSCQGESMWGYINEK